MFLVVVVVVVVDFALRNLIPSPCESRLGGNGFEGKGGEQRGGASCHRA